MKSCFVIQRFDAAIYDKRYKETFAPAIERGGAKPIRADQVLGTRPVVEKIEAELRSADIAFAEVSEDNPNVFLELGFALALSIPTVIVCDRAKRTKLPFDIAHRPINFYITDALSDHQKIAHDVEKSVSAALLESKSSNTSRSTEHPTNGDEDNVKRQCLLALLDYSLRSPTGATLWEIQKEVASVGITERMVSLAVISLLNTGLIQKLETTDMNGETYIAFSLTDSGNTHILRSYNSLIQMERDRVNFDDDEPF